MKNYGISYKGNVEVGYKNLKEAKKDALYYMETFGLISCSIFSYQSELSYQAEKAAEIGEVLLDAKEVERVYND